MDLKIKEAQAAKANVAFWFQVDDFSLCERKSQGPSRWRRRREWALLHAVVLSSKPKYFLQQHEIFAPSYHPIPACLRRSSCSRRNQNRVWQIDDTSLFLQAQFAQVKKSVQKSKCFLSFKFEFDSAKGSCKTNVKQMTTLTTSRLIRLVLQCPVYREFVDSSKRKLD